MDDIFQNCTEINQLINLGKESEARNSLIKLLDNIQRPYPDYLNHLIRETGLYPYMDTDTANWQDVFVHEIFKVDIGEAEPVTLHREQSYVLKNLLEGKNIALSAPTSFGKSFIIDSLIAIKKPHLVMIIVPTIALMDETRRRLTNKFGNHYKIITIPNSELADNTILIFPQERAFGYADLCDDLDILIVDEFYKVSKTYDDRSDILLRAVMEIGKKAKQRYYLSPNIAKIKDFATSAFTKDMNFIQELDFNTVVTKINNSYQEKDFDKNKKLIRLLTTPNFGKTLLYAGTHTSLKNITSLLIDKMPEKDTNLLNSFSDWIGDNYSTKLTLYKLVKRGIGLHNGKLHRSLAQLMIKIFESGDDLETIVSTSSIIQGVNTSAKNVIMWQRKNGTSALTSLDYKNLIGRGGRMFRHFTGNVYLFEKPIPDVDTQLDVDFSDNIQVDIDIEAYTDYLSEEKKNKINTLKSQLETILGRENVEKLIRERKLKFDNMSQIVFLAQFIKENKNLICALKYLNSSDESQWGTSLYNIIRYCHLKLPVNHRSYVNFIKIISKNWINSIPELFSKLEENAIPIDEFFTLERHVVFNFSSLLNEINELQKSIYPNEKIDISSFIQKISFAFLPSSVYYLEEYGLPRMLSQKIQNAGVINFENNQFEHVLEKLKSIGFQGLTKNVKDLDSFDKSILEYFYDGI